MQSPNGGGNSPLIFLSMKFKMSLIVEDMNGQGLEAFDVESCNELESRLQEMANKYPFIVGEEHLTVITLKVANMWHSQPLPEEMAFYGEVLLEENVQEEVYELEMPEEEESIDAIPCKPIEDDSSRSETMSD